MKKIVCYLFLTAIIFPAGAQSPVNNSEAITFKIKNFGLWTEGSVHGLKGEMKFDHENPSNSLFDVTVEANSVETGIGLRDNHLRKEEYLDVKNYPQIKFVSTKVAKGVNPNQWILTGFLTIKKVTKEITFPFLLEVRSGYNLFTGEFVINRKDFGVGGESLSMADELTIYLTVIN